MRPDLPVSRETSDELSQLVDLILTESLNQNLIASSTRDEIWSRHIIDSLQLIPLASSDGCWIDIGSGAGLPGLVVAICRQEPVILVEPRARRAQFLQHCRDQLGLDHVTIAASRIETFKAPIQPVSTISARAVARLDRLFAMAHHLSNPDTIWVLPKGRSAAAELAEARKTWQGRFELVPSQTDPDAWIVVARDVQSRVSR